MLDERAGAEIGVHDRAVQRRRCRGERAGAAERAGQCQAADRVAIALHVEHRTGGDSDQSRIGQAVRPAKAQRAAGHVDGACGRNAVQVGNTRMLDQRAGAEIGENRRAVERVGGGGQRAGAAERAGQRQAADGLVVALQIQRRAGEHRHDRSIGKPLVRAELEHAALDMHSGSGGRAVEQRDAAALIDRAGAQIMVDRAAEQIVDRRSQRAAADQIARDGEAGDGLVEAVQVERRAVAHLERRIVGKHPGGPEAQRAGIDQGEAGIGVGTREGQHAGARLGEAAGAADHAAKVAVVIVPADRQPVGAKGHGAVAGKIGDLDVRAGTRNVERAMGDQRAAADRAGAGERQCGAAVDRGGAEIVVRAAQRAGTAGKGKVAQARDPARKVAGAERKVGEDEPDRAAAGEAGEGSAPSSDRERAIGDDGAARKRAAVEEQRRAAVDVRVARIGVGAGQYLEARGDGQAAAAPDDAVEAGVVGAVERQRVGAELDRAAVAQAAELGGAARHAREVERGAAGHGNGRIGAERAGARKRQRTDLHRHAPKHVLAGERQRAGAIFDEAAAPREGRFLQGAGEESRRAVVHGQALRPEIDAAARDAGQVVDPLADARADVEDRVRAGERDRGRGEELVRPAQRKRAVGDDHIAGEDSAAGKVRRARARDLQRAGARQTVHLDGAGPVGGQRAAVQRDRAAERAIGAAIADGHARTVQQRGDAAIAPVGGDGLVARGDRHRAVVVARRLGDGAGEAALAAIAGDAEHAVAEPDVARAGEIGEGERAGCARHVEDAVHGDGRAGDRAAARQREPRAGIDHGGAGIGVDAAERERAAGEAQPATALDHARESGARAADGQVLVAERHGADAGEPADRVAGARHARQVERAAGHRHCHAAADRTAAGERERPAVDAHRCQIALAGEDEPGGAGERKRRRRGNRAARRIVEAAGEHGVDTLDDAHAMIAIADHGAGDARERVDRPARHGEVEHRARAGKRDAAAVRQHLAGVEREGAVRNGDGAGEAGRAAQAGGAAARLDEAAATDQAGDREAVRTIDGERAVRGDRAAHRSAGAAIAEGEAGALRDGRRAIGIGAGEGQRAAGYDEGAAIAVADHAGEHAAIVDGQHVAVEDEAARAGKAADGLVGTEQLGGAGRADDQR